MNRLLVVISVFGVLCLAPASAFAANPAKNSAFSWCEKKNICSFSFETDKKGKKLGIVRLYSKCLPVPLMDGWPSVAVKNGKFSKSGTVVDVLGNAVKFKLVGKFTSKKKAVGTFDIDKKGCSAKPTKFVAKRTGKASGQVL
jgi:hypothetical protein